MARLFDNWVYGGFVAGFMILLLMPMLAQGWSPTLTAIFLLLSVYMLHQYEEHDRFRLYFNRTIGQGAEVLTPAAAFVINIGAVWLAQCGIDLPRLGISLGYLAATLTAIVASRTELRNSLAPTLLWGKWRKTLHIAN